MRFTSWWVQAIGRGATMALAIWLVSVAGAVIGLFLAGWGPLAFLRLVSMVGPYILVIVLAFTAPFWVLGGLIVLVSLGSKETSGRRGATLRERIGDGSDRSAQEADGRGGQFRRQWLRRCNNIERSVAGRFVLLPVLSRSGTDISTVDGSAVPDEAYLRTYARTWSVQALALFGTIILIAAISTLGFPSGNKAELPEVFIHPVIPAFAIAVCVCNVAAVRYAVTRKVLKHLAAMDSDDARFEGGQE